MMPARTEVCLHSNLHQELEMAAAPLGGTSDGKAGGDGGAVLKRGVQALEHDVLSKVHRRYFEALPCLGQPFYCLCGQ